MNYQMTFYLFYCLAAVTFFSVFYYTIKFSSNKRKIKKEEEEAASALAENFENLRQEIQNQVDKLERKETLTPEEQKDYEMLKDALDHSKNPSEKEKKTSDDDF